MRKGILITSLISVALIAVYYSANQTKNDPFQEWKRNFGVSWLPEEEAYRRLIFEKNFLFIEKHNSDVSQTYKMGINQFTIYTTEEFISRFLTPMGSSNSIQIQDEVNQANVEIDWTTKGKVSAVKNQGQCGSCWAFSATGVVETFYLFKGQSHSFSEQQLVDCSKSYGNNGCNGGSRASALNYIKDHGITTESAYPYVGKDQSCKTQGGAYKIAGHTTFSGCNGLTSAISSHPIAVAVDAGGWSTYHSGVFNNCKTNINHAVLLVGVVSGNWKIKNSWGTSWGESGFMRLASGNTCGICLEGGIFPS